MREALTSPRTPEVLLVEDSPADVRLLMETFKDGAFRHRLSVAWDGDDALAFLHRSGRYAAAPRPDLIILDLNLPGKDGREVLREIKADAALGAIPLVILTTSDADQDVVATHDLHANCYIVKPVRYEMYSDVLKSIERFWLRAVKLPSLYA